MKKIELNLNILIIFIFETKPIMNNISFTMKLIFVYFIILILDIFRIICSFQVVQKIINCVETLYDIIWYCFGENDYYEIDDDDFVNNKDTELTNDNENDIDEDIVDVYSFQSYIDVIKKFC